MNLTWQLIQIMFKKSKSSAMNSKMFLYEAHCGRRTLQYHVKLEK